MIRRKLLGILIVITLIFSGCFKYTKVYQPDKQEDKWKIQMSHYRVEFKIHPEEPFPDEEAILELEIWDIRSSTPVPVSNAEIACIIRMPDIAGHIHILGEHRGHSEIQPGHYTMEPLKLGMGGNWEAVYSIKLKNKQEYQEYKIKFPIRVRQELEK